MVAVRCHTNLGGGGGGGAAHNDRVTSGEETRVTERRPAREGKEKQEGPGLRGRCSGEREVGGRRVGRGVGGVRGGGDARFSVAEGEGGLRGGGEGGELYERGGRGEAGGRRC